MDDRLQRAADYFLQCADWKAVKPTKIGADILPHLIILGIERDVNGRASSLPVRFTGTGLDQAFGRPLAGRRLGEFVHGPRGQDVIRGFMACADDRRPIWMRQIVRLKGDAPRFVEGVVVHVGPERLYGALLMGQLADQALQSGFEIKDLSDPVAALT